MQAMHTVLTAVALCSWCVQTVRAQEAGAREYPLSIKTKAYKTTDKKTSWTIETWKVDKQMGPNKLISRVVFASNTDKLPSDKTGGLEFIFDNSMAQNEIVVHKRDDEIYPRPCEQN